jgi:DNA-binding SARP family transcriptional activator/DNA-binding XRE family transcriptional regulator
LRDEPGSFGATLRAARVGAGLTQQELGQRAGVSVRALRDIEQGRVQQPLPVSVRRLAVAVGLDPTEALSTSRRGTTSKRRPDPGRPGAEQLEVGVLGPLRVQRGGRPVMVGSLKQRCLLGLLALQPDRVVGREELIDVLWGEHPPASCRNLVHTYVARLRRVLGPRRAPGATARVIVAAGGGYRLMADNARLDLLWFDELAARASEVQASDPAAALALLTEALGCWRGRVLADLTDGLHQHPAAVAVGQRRVAAVLAHADLALGLGQYQQAVAGLRPLAHEEPLHEGVHAWLMLALAGCGQQAAALEVFTSLRSRLAEELGVEPGAELQDAQVRVLRGDLPAVQPSNHGSTIRTAGLPSPAQLPADVAGFTGRAGHLEQLDALLPAAGEPAATAVVVTVIVGMAGVGKTALAIHWAHRVAGRFGDGQLYVNLRGYAAGPPLDPAQALAGLLGGLGVDPDKIPVELEAAAGLYRSLLAGKRMLVVLDNAQSAEQVRPLLPGHPGSMVLITSRDRLTGLVATHGAHRLTLEVLTPDEAVALLARLLGQDRVAAEPASALELAQVCGLLPLALRIAAANLTGQPGQSINGYLTALQAGNRLADLAVDGDPHAAVRVAFGHSYQHLSTDSRRLFRLLGLVPGPEVSVPAAAALAGMSLAQAGRLLNVLVDAHLAEPRGPGRASMHDLLRLYARERTGQEDSPPERDAALGRLLDWYLHAADAAAGRLYPDLLRLPVPPADAVPPLVNFEEDAGAVAWLDGERANLVAAVQHAAEHGPQASAWLLADVLRGYFWLRRHTLEWLLVANAGLTAATAGGDVRAQAASQLSLGHAHAAVGRYPQAIQHYTAALILARQAGWTDGQAASLSELGLGYWRLGNLQQAADHHTQALALYRQTGRQGGQAGALLHLGVVYRYLGRLQQAADQETRALALYRQLGSRQGEAQALGNLGVADHELGRLDHAHQHLTCALTLLQQVGNRFGQAYILLALAAVHRDAGRYPQALAAAQVALRLAAEIGHRYIEAAAGNTLASIHLCLGHRQLARDQHQQVLDLARQTATRAPEAEALLGLAAVCQYNGQHLQAVDHAQQARTIAHKAGLRVLEGQAHTALAAAHHALGHHEQALNHAKQALDLHRRTGHRLGQARTLQLLGRVLRDTDGVQSAAACWREALGLFADIGSPDADGLRELLGA